MLLLKSYNCENCCCLANKNCKLQAYLILENFRFSFVVFLHNSKSGIFQQKVLKYITREVLYNTNIKKIHSACLHCKRCLFHCFHTLKNENRLS